MSCKQRVIFRYCKVMWLLLYLLCYNVANASEVEKVNVLSRTLDTKPVVDGKLAYNLSYQNWAHSQDLKEMSSYALSDGPDGYLWIASDSGLYKFDGTQRFLHSAYKDDSDTIFQLASDNEGYLWGVTARKVIVVDKELEVTTLDSPVRDYIGKVFVSSLTKDAQGNVWFEGLNKIYRASGGQLTKVFESTSEIIGIYGSQEAGFWMVSKNQAQRVNLDGQVVQTISFADIQLHKQFSFFEDRDNHVWLSQQNRVYIFDGNNLVEKYTLIGASSIDALFQYGNNILVASADGIRIISNDKERRIYFLETKIKERSANATYVDAQRRIWVGGWRAGLHRLSQAELEFLKNSPFISMVSLKQEEGIYWVGGSKGLRKIDHEQVIDLLDQTLYGVVTGLEMNAEKSVLYAAFEHGIFEIDLDGSNAMKKMGGLDGMRIFEFALYKKGELLLGTDVGLLVYNIENESYKRPMSASEDASDRVYFIEPIADGLWLVGFRDDVFIFDGETLKPAANKKLNNIFDASYDPKTDSVLMIKRSDELEIFQWHRGRIRALPVGQVTKPFDPYNIHVDKINHVWVQGEFKVVRISLKALYSRADFVPLQLFSHSANSTLECNASGDIFEDDDGVIYFPCYEGVYLIDSNEVPSLRKSPEPRFIAMHVNGQEVSLLKNTETSLPINSRELCIIPNKSPKNVKIQST